MRIRNPPTFIMSISLIMSLIMTLLVFQCGLWVAVVIFEEAAVCVLLHSLSSF